MNPLTPRRAMSKSAFTPGPWRVEKPEDELIKFRVHYIGERPTVEIWTDGKDGFYQPVALVADDDEANARLIAAAPDLYEALKGVVKVADRATVEFEAARAAIAKAEGR